MQTNEIKAKQRGPVRLEYSFCRTSRRYWPDFCITLTGDGFGVQHGRNRRANTLNESDPVMNTIRIAGTTFALLLFSVAAHAVPIQATYTIDANTEEPGLRIETDPVAPNPFSYNLAVGESTTFDLFEITVGSGPGQNDDEGGSSPDPDDKVPKPISVTFGFELPADGTATITGTTVATRPFDGSSTLAGLVEWNGPIDFFYGSNNEGHIRIALSDETFASGDLINLGLPGESAIVEATLTLVDDANVAVPAPGMLVLFGLSLLGAAGVARRRRSVARS